jgi:ribosomal protein S12 methylthiotransferase accessory factor
MGITRVANLTGLDLLGVPVFTAIRPNSRSLATSQGKALDPSAARVSAFMEAVEFWHAEHVRGPTVIDSVHGLTRDALVVDVDEVHRYRAIDRMLPRAWLPGWDLMAQRDCYVPFEAVTLNFVRPAAVTGDFQSSSNGLASGNHLLEAIVHGLCEVIERDATCLWELDPESRLLDLASVGSAPCQEVIRRIRAAGTEVAAWDTTSDVGVPTFTAIVIDPPSRRTWRRLGVYAGVGTHLEPGVALLRALTEAVQSRLGFISGSRDDGFRSRYRQVTNESYVADIWSAIQAEPTVTFDAFPSRATPTFEGDLETLLAALRGRGIGSAVVVDLTRDDLAIPVAKVIVPGLAGIGEGELPVGRVRAARARLDGAAARVEEAA